MIFIYDTETDGKVNFKKDETSPDQPHLIQFAGALFHGERIIKAMSTIIYPSRPIPKEITEVHGITEEIAKKTGTKNISFVLKWWIAAAGMANLIAGHNLRFDRTVMLAEAYRSGMKYPREILKKPTFDTMIAGVDVCKLPRKKGKGYKWPKLDELHEHLFGKKVDGAHDALEDVRATARCLFKLKAMGLLADAHVDEDLYGEDNNG